MDDNQQIYNIKMLKVIKITRKCDKKIKQKFKQW